MKVLITFSDTHKHQECYAFTVRHLRDAKSSYGGTTIMGYSFATVPQLIVSKCRPDEKFSRQAGILCCLQRFISRTFKGMSIVDFAAPTTQDRELYKITVTSQNVKPYWWTHSPRPKLENRMV